MTSANSLSDSRTVLLYAVTSFQSHVLVDGLINLIPSDRYKVILPHLPTTVASALMNLELSTTIVFMKRNPHLLYDFLSLLSVLDFFCELGQPLLIIVLLKLLYCMLYAPKFFVYPPASI